jgi:hypothetical protein
MCVFEKLQFANDKDYLPRIVNLQYVKSMYIGTYTIKDELIIFTVRVCVGLITVRIKYMLQYGEN